MRLSDAFIDIFAFGTAFRREAAGAAPAGYEETRAKVLQGLAQSESHPAAQPAADYDAARYALCAWLDEAVLSSGWAHKTRWRAELLQRRFYQATDAGQRFFDRLAALDPLDKRVREVYYLCLALGFQGKHCTAAGAPVLEHLKQQQLRILLDGTAEVPTLAQAQKSPLFPDAYPTETPARAPRRRLFGSAGWGLVAAPACALAILFLIFRFTLHSLGSGILKVLGS